MIHTFGISASFDGAVIVGRRPESLSDSKTNKTVQVEQSFKESLYMVNDLVEIAFHRQTDSLR